MLSKSEMERAEWLPSGLTGRAAYVGEEGQLGGSVSIWGARSQGLASSRTLTWRQGVRLSERPLLCKRGRMCDF